MPGLTDHEELADEEGLIVTPGVYIICLRCRQVWPA
jgi:hypothetical protein